MENWSNLNNRQMRMIKIAITMGSKLWDWYKLNFSLLTLECISWCFKGCQCFSLVSFSLTHHLLFHRHIKTLQWTTHRRIPVSSHTWLSPIPVPLSVWPSGGDGPPREAACCLRAVHEARPPHSHGLPSWRQTLHQLHGRPEPPGCLPHLASQQEEGGQVDGHLLPPHNLPLRPHQLSPGAQLPGPCRALSGSGERTMGHLQGHDAPYQGGGDARWTQPAPWRPQPPWQPGQLPPAQGGCPGQHPQPRPHHPSPQTPLLMMPITTLYISLSAINILHTN